MSHLSEERLKLLADLENKLQISFNNKLLLNKSLTHSSYAHEHGGEIKDNERLEFLGDAVLKLVMSEYLVHKFPQHPEGELTKIRAAVVSDANLSVAAKNLDLGGYLLLGSNELRSGGNARKSNVANALEALLGAIYLDSGIGKARDIILSLIGHDVEKVTEMDYLKDYKSALQEIAQKNKWGLPVYRVTKEIGPKHRRIFWIQVKIKGRDYGTGRGKTKKEAEQSAAKFALKRLDEEKKQKPKESGFRGLRDVFSKVGRRREQKKHEKPE